MPGMKKKCHKEESFACLRVSVALSVTGWLIASWPVVDVGTLGWKFTVKERVLWLVAKNWQTERRRGQSPNIPSRVFSLGHLFHLPNPTSSKVLHSLTGPEVRKQAFNTGAFGGYGKYKLWHRQELILIYKGAYGAEGIHTEPSAVRSPNKSSLSCFIRYFATVTRTIRKASSPNGGGREEGRERERRAREEMILPAAAVQTYVTNSCYVAGGTVTAVTHWAVQSL